MPLTDEQIQHIERLKRELRIDQHLGRAVSEQSRSRGHFAGIDPVSPDRGQEIVEGTFNPTIRRILADLDGR